MSKAKKYLSNLRDLLEHVKTPYGKGKNSVGIMGIRSDVHSSFLRGCAGAPERIREAFLSDSCNTATEMGKNIIINPVEQHFKSENFAKKLETEASGGVTGSYTVLDLGDMEFSKDDEKNPDEMFKDIVEACRLINSKNITPLFLGGDHSITYPLFVGLCSTPKYHIGNIKAGSSEGGEWQEPGDNDVESPHIIHFDAHPDLYPDFEGNPYSHASPFARIAETGLAGKITQFGVRCGNSVQNNFIRDFPSIEQVPMQQVFRMSPKELSEAIEEATFSTGRSQTARARTYLSIDLDVLDPAFAPGLSHHEPGGMDVRTLLHMIQSVPRCAMLGADIVEYNPTRDRDNVTAMVAAKVMKEVIPLLALRDGKHQEVTLPKNNTKKKALEWPWKRPE
eukprot:TRINITY_DN20798_c3_g1_i1.p1 TRINITY_DN20798_c3_g1~~TRINITY_DN20798_c3_g1_i1.p1  ORF type:complete len:412 (+),score=89.49 TRINITY_DN20798_c3_g1_i1:59-1237(+)